MGNAYRGEVLIEVGAERRPLRFTWDAIARLRAEFGPEYAGRIETALNTHDVEAIAKVIGVGCGMEPSAVLSASPPLVPTISAVYRAISLAYHGPDGPAEEKPGNVLARVATWLRRRTAPPSGPDSVPSSGG